MRICRDVQDSFNAAVQAALPGTVYDAGCRSYYIDSNGRNSFSWPWSTDRMLAALSHFDPDEYVADRAAAPAA